MQRNKFNLIHLLPSLLLCMFAIISVLSFVSYSPFDLSFHTITNETTQNLVSIPGAYFADIMLQYFGIASFALPLSLGVFAALRLKIKITYKIRHIGFVLAAIFSFAITLSAAKDYQYYFQYLFGGGFGSVALSYIQATPVSNPLYAIITVCGIMLFGMSIGLDSIIFKKESSLKQAKKRVNKVKAKPKKNDGETEKVDKSSLPFLDLLSNVTSSSGITKKNEAIAAKMVSSLLAVFKDFAIEGDIQEYKVGPVLSIFEFEPKPGIKAAKIIGLADDVARYLKVISVRMYIVQGKSTIGIEVPNQNREIFGIKSLMPLIYKNDEMALPFIAGVNVYNTPCVVDIARMPHLMIAGTTGSGKSVGVNALILSLLFSKTPQQCRFVMIDPKMLELSVYEGIPHLLTPVVTDPKKAVVTLQWVTKEMDKRYKLMSGLGVRNLQNYNSAVPEEEKLPMIVVIVDEMADLMLTSGKAIEGCIQRLSQMARAAGIHLIISTQRPSVDVITGVIKANFPIRISYQVPSSTDSRTILGYQGAEKLLGKGDMLYMPTGGKTIRMHSPFVSDDDVVNVVRFFKESFKPNYDESVEAEINSLCVVEETGGDINAEGNGDLYSEAVAVVMKDKKTSISYVQRKLRIGYNKAASLIEQMEQEGILSEPDTKGKRLLLKK